MCTVWLSYSGLTISCSVEVLNSVSVYFLLVTVLTIIAVFVFYAHWARARHTVFASATSGWQAMAILPLLNQSEAASILASQCCQGKFC